MSNKRPSFQFYPNDWMNDLGLRQCSAAARCLWIDMLCIMHDGEPYGHLQTASGNLPLRWLANRTGMPMKTVNICILELTKNKVLSLNSEGTIFSRRMVRDEEVRDKRAACGPLSANNLNVPTKRKDTQKDPLEGYPEGPPVVPSFGGSPSSSSSSSIEEKTPTESKRSASPKNGSATSHGSRFSLESLPEEWFAHCRSPELNWEAPRIHNTFAVFSDYWMAKAGAGARKADWLATWRNWCRKEEANGNTQSAVLPMRTARDIGPTQRAIDEGNRRMAKNGRLY